MRFVALFTALLLAGPVAESPVADAAQRGDLEIVRTLLRDGADVNAAQGDGMSALHWAAQNGQAEIVDVLLYAGANPEATTRLAGYTPLHLASRAGNAGAITKLLEGQADVSARSGTGVTALHFAAASGRADAVSALVAGGAEVDGLTSSDDQTPLMWATAYNRLDAMRALLEEGADVALTTRVVDYVTLAEKDRPARRARQQLVTAQRNSEELDEPDEVEDLAVAAEPIPTRGSAGTAAPQREARTPREEAAVADSTQAAEAPAETATPEEEAVAEQGAASEEEASDEEAAPEEEDASDETPEEDAEEDATEAPAPEAPPLSYNDLVGKEGGFTAMHFAARDGRMEAAQLLLEHGSEIDQPTAGDGTTPLLMATINGNFDLAMSLLDHGADPNRVAEDGSAPLFTVLNRRWGPKAAYPQPSAFQQQRTDYLEIMTALLDAGAEVDHRTGRHIWYTSFNFDMLGVGFTGSTPFWRAAYATDLDAMKLLVSYGADPTLATRKVPSRRFGRGGNSEDKSGLPVVPTGGPAVFPIHAASGVGYGEGFAANSHSHAPDSWLPAVQYLVEVHGADVNTRDLNGYSPVHHAAARGDNALIEYLVAQGADVTVVSRRGETTVDMANGPRQRVNPFPTTIALLESLGAINNHNCQSC